MEEGIKNRIILVLCIVSLMFLLVSVRSCGSDRKHKIDLENQKAEGWDLQKKVEEIKQEKANIENELKAKIQGLEEEKAAHQATKKALVQEELVNKSLKEEIEKVSKLKDTLEEDLKDVLVTDKNKIKK